MNRIADITFKIIAIFGIAVFGALAVFLLIRHNPLANHPPMMKPPAIVAFGDAFQLIVMIMLKTSKMKP